ncbi:type II toxin-antitoxin system VapC family toxin [Myxacorys almedinensis]|uniref:PIN domain-containing protein n=1 Tax=Myxacorys almedinensis A TaxID=2690445 RepID=A0A8J8CHP5_9CYAN|nr:type II toxin-antitoxin system VapC family toxin [Myxacorys almedinensis]NDJ16894.1 PIN domain-containing protein [Myxacorys almedinensis A]
MNGSRYVLDTNAIVALLQGNVQLIQLLQTADWLGIAIISQIEFLVFAGLSETDRQLFQEFLQRIEIIDLTAKDVTLIDKVIEVRQQYRLKLPDAIVAAIAIHSSAGLITADQEFMKVDVLTVVNW